MRLIPDNRWLSVAILLVGLVTLIGTGPGVVSGEERAILPVFAVVLSVVVVALGAAGLVRSVRRGH